MLVIACAGVLGWLLMLGVALCLAAAAKRGDEVELNAARYLPDSDPGATILAFERPRSDSAERTSSAARDFAPQ